jgi:hypothetical protein
MLRSLVVQLSWQSQSLPEPFDELYEEHFNGGRQPSNSDIVQLIATILQEFKHVFLVLDALDE